MKRIMIVALAVLSVCMAATASASAHEFTAKLTGKLLLGVNTNNQVFKTTPASETPVTCTKAATTGTILTVKALHQLVDVFYSNCEAFASVAEISTAKYLLSADGLAAIENTIIITVKSILGTCTVTVHPQDLGTVKYEPDPVNSAALLELSAVTGIVSLSSGGVCGTKGTLTGGTYEGTNLVFEDGTGGAIGWS